jgi:GyrI-like small molecule binding domain
VDVVEREETPILFLRAADTQEGITAAWEALESRFESLRGRRFFGAVYPEANEYLACVRVEAGDDAVQLALESGSLPGGTYARVRLTGEPPQVYDLIGPTFAALERRPERDDTRPSIEHYRRRDEIDLLLPVTGAISA